MVVQEKPLNECQKDVYCFEAILTFICSPLFRSVLLSQHTTVLPFIIIEMRTTHHRYPSRSWGLAAVCCFGVGYILW